MIPHEAIRKQTQHVREMAEISGYKALPLRMRPDSKHCHSIYMREHFIRLLDHNKPKGRTLFLLNVPPYVTEDSLKTFFSACGIVTAVYFAEKPGRDEVEKWYENCRPFSSGTTPFKFKVAYVVFKTSTSVSRALELESIDLFNKGTGESLVESGLQLWIKQCNKRFLNEEELQSQIDKYMADYDKREREEQQAAKTTEADADGWVTVGKAGRNSGFQQKEATIGRLEEKIERGKKKELNNFYTFQIREAKMKNVMEMRKKFEEDKEKIEAMKKSRRFRPF